MRYTPSGVPVTNFSVAVNRRWTNSDGTDGEEVTWYRVTAWRRLAEVCNEYLTKGRQVLVEGRLIPDPETGGPRVWTGKDGVARASFEVTASQVRFLGSGNGNSAQAPDEGAEPEEDEEIPF
jgi:single-strand DNA-binding protein